jgi:hypothetical protein
VRTAVGSLVVALLLAGAGVVSWTLGRSERDLAELHADVATLRFAAAADRAVTFKPIPGQDLLPGIGSVVGANSRDDRATADYWLARYDRLAGERGADGVAVAPDLQQRLLASNAAFRTAQTESVDRTTSLKHLEDVVKAYADVLKTSPDADAAYNYEFVVRTRNTLARATNVAAKPGAPPATPALHGRAGAPPQNVSMAGFKVIIPQRSDERTESEEAGKGGVKRRKG